MASVSDTSLEPHLNLFSCEFCGNVWDDPVTIKCGHTFCRKCVLIENSVVRCSRCAETFHADSARGPRTNVLLSSVLAAFDRSEMSVAVQSVDDFECALCLRLLLHPMTMSCGHTFCRGCIYRSLDHRILCPLCKESLAQFLAERRETTTEAVEKIIQRFFPKELEARSKLETDEMKQLQISASGNSHEIPIFVCMIAYPGVPCPLRIFEPRYRLMMRRCMESGTRQFGMCTCLESREEDFYEYGTILEIRDIRYLPDGQSFVDCVGARRFRVLTRGVRDGYRTASVEILKDEAPAPDQIDDLQQLQRKVYDEAVDWFASISPISRASITQSLGNLPALEESVSNLCTSPDGPAWVWYVVAILPVDQRAQLCFVEMTSLRERLVALQRVLRYFSRRGQSS